MNKVLIVDDEVLSIEYLKSLSAWKKYWLYGDRLALGSRRRRWSVLKRNTIQWCLWISVCLGMDGLALSREFLKICPDTVSCDHDGLAGI